MKNFASDGKTIMFCRMLYVAVTLVLASCGGGGGGNGGGGTQSFAATTPSSDNWTAGDFLPASTYQGMCVSPGPGERRGTSTDENNFLRSFSNDTYLWYDEIVDRNPALYTTSAYFDLLKTTAVTPSGNPKDQFHFSIPTDEWNAQSQSGASVGYGAQFGIISLVRPGRRIVVAYTDPGTPATAPGANLLRGESIDAIDGNNIGDANIDTYLDGLYPDTAGETHTFRVTSRTGVTRTFTMQSAVVTSTPVQNVSTIDTGTGKVGYLLFNDHIATAERGLFDAVTQLAAAGINDLVVDIRYNGGGYLDIASELAYMIAGSARTAGRTFEVLRFNNKHPLFDPITGQPLIPVPFHNRSQGIDPSLPAGTLLPTLNLSRVYLITGEGTCSASESIINSLRGIDVGVIQIGSTTCGKPYGFYPEDNCGTTYFTIQFQGVNAKGFGDYTDGFSPANTRSSVGTIVAGCSVADDFLHLLGDPSELRLQAALNLRASGPGSCPSPTGIASPRAISADSSSVPGPVTVQEKVTVLKTVWQQNRIMR